MVINASSIPANWDPPNEVRTQFVYRCAAKYCGKTHIFEYLGMSPMIPHRPDGWWLHRGEWFCPGHKVEVKVDGKALE